MPKVHVQLLTGQFIPNKNNKLEAFQPGDWVKVGKHKAREWLCTGQATLPDIKQADAIIAGDVEDAGVCAIGTNDGTQVLTDRYELRVTVSDIPALPYERTLIWNPIKFPLDRRQAVMGLTLLESEDGYDAWDLAAMLATSNPMAMHIGSPDERKRLKAVVGDLRVPVYETNALWVRRSAASRTFIAEWVRVLKDGINERLAFIEAWYKAQPSIYTLEAGWLHPWWEK